MSLKVQTSNVTNRKDPESINSRVFIGNLNTAVVQKADVEAIFSQHGEVLGCSVHKGYAFVQYGGERQAQSAVLAQNGRVLAGQTLDINMAGEPKPQRSPGVKRPVSALYSGYDSFRDDFYERLLDYRSRASLIPRPVPVKRPRVAVPVMRRVKSLPVKLASRSPVAGSRSVRHKLKTSELQAIRADLAQIKANIDTLLGHLEVITQSTELHRAGEGNGEVSADESATDTESRHNHEEEEGDEATQEECEEFTEYDHLKTDSILQ
ncbi:RNA-binding protein Raly-like [Conger conger]|uniref:RNA-binding protein Raly-like n=1 Tax=Conger conger TaxID=82655 RepID=UPI002A5ADC48|nr:RNA-binding protein Raly-like [Conger conger]